QGYSNVAFQITGTWSATVKFEGTVNGTTWIPVAAVSQKMGGSTDSVATANGVYAISTASFKKARARVSAYSSGTATLQAFALEGPGVMALQNSTSGGTASNVAVTSIAAGNNNIGDVDVATVPTDPFGANADAASATGSI